MKSVSLMLALTLSLSTTAALAQSMMDAETMEGKIAAAKENSAEDMRKEMKTKLEDMQEALNRAAQVGKPEALRNQMGRLLNQANDAAKNAFYSNNYELISEANINVSRIHNDFIQTIKAAQ